MALQNNFMFLSVIIPAYNESKNIKAKLLEQVPAYLSKQDYTWEVVIVDDGSTDDTLALAKAFAKKHKHVRVLAQPHRGKAGTVIAGMLDAKGENILFTDTDQATPINQLEKLLPKLDVGYDIVIGSRSGRKGAPLVRKLMAFGFIILRTLILRLPFRDTQCGFKLFSSKASKSIFQKMKKMHGGETIKGYTVTAGFDLEVLYLARKLGFRVAEVGVVWEDRGKGQVNPIKDSWIGFKGLLQVRINSLTGKYKVK